MLHYFLLYSVHNHKYLLIHTVQSFCDAEFYFESLVIAFICLFIFPHLYQPSNKRPGYTLYETFCHVAGAINTDLFYRVNIYYVTNSCSGVSEIQKPFQQLKCCCFTHFHSLRAPPNITPPDFFYYFISFVLLLFFRGKN